METIDDVPIISSLPALSTRQEELTELDDDSQAGSLWTSLK